jgi:hypothetical protein
MNFGLSCNMFRVVFIVCQHQAEMMSRCSLDRIDNTHSCVFEKWKQANARSRIISITIVNVVIQSLWFNIQWHLHLRPCMSSSHGDGSASRTERFCVCPLADEKYSDLVNTPYECSRGGQASSETDLRE